jgi:putative DNA primase/helicase
VALEGAIEGERDDLLFRLACRLRASGVPQQKAEEIVLLAASRCSPPFDPDDARRKVASAWRYASNCAQTDLSNSLRLTHRYAGKIRYAFKLKKWIYWDSTRWCIDEDGQVSRYARATVMAIYEEITTNPESAEGLLKHAKQSQQASRLDAMERLARTEEGIPIAPEYLDADQWLLGTPQGVIDLRTGIVRDPKPEDLITKSTTACLDAGAQCVRWRQFLLEIMDGKVHMVQFLQRAIGYTLTGSTKEQCLFFLYGSGANGKSTLLNILGHVLGDYAIRSPAETLVTRRERGVPNDVARMHGSRLVITSEIEEGTYLAESLVKQLTGGDRLVARYLFAEFFEFVPAFKIWLAANHKPRIRGDDFAIWRRIRLIPFLAEFSPEKQDPELLGALLKEDAGILAWAVQGCLDWQTSGLQPPEEVMAATAAYRSEMDTFKQWLDERCEVDANPGSALEVKSSELYQDYTTWAKSNGLHPASVVRFASRLGDRGLNKLRKKGGIFYRGIRLKGPDEPDM